MTSYCGIKNYEVVWKNQIEYVEMKSVYFTHPMQILSCQKGIAGADVCDFIQQSNLKCNAIPVLWFLSVGIFYMEKEERKSDRKSAIK